MSAAKEQLIREIETLSDTKVEQVAIFISALKAQNDAPTLEAKFAEEDRALAEAAGVGYLADLTLEEMLAQITEENRHEEIDWGPPVGKEVW